MDQIQTQTPNPAISPPLPQVSAQKPLKKKTWKFWGGLVVLVLLLVSAFILGKPGFFKGMLPGPDTFQAICENNYGTIDNVGNCNFAQPKLHAGVPQGDIKMLQAEVDAQIEARCNTLKAGGLHAEFIAGGAATNGACNFNMKTFYNLKELDSEEKAVSTLSNSCTGIALSGLWMADTDGKGYRCKFNDKEFTTANLTPINLLQDERVVAQLFIQLCKDNYGELGGGSLPLAGAAGTKITCTLDGKTYIPNPPNPNEALSVGINNAINRLRTLCTSPFAKAYAVILKNDKECTLPAIDQTPVTTYTINQTSKVESGITILTAPLHTLCENDVTVQRNEGYWPGDDWACVFPEKLKSGEELTNFKERKYYTEATLKKAIEEEKIALETLCTKDPLAVKNGATFDKAAPMCLFLNVNYETTAAFKKAIQTELEAFKKLCLEEPLLQQYKPIFDYKNNTCKLTPHSPDMIALPPIETRTKLEESITLEKKQINELCIKLHDLGIQVTGPGRESKEAYCEVKEKKYKNSFDLAEILKRETDFKKACETANGKYADLKCDVPNVGIFVSVTELQDGLAASETCKKDETKEWNTQQQQCVEKSAPAPEPKPINKDFQNFCTERAKGIWDPEFMKCTIDGKEFKSLEEVFFSKMCAESKGTYENKKCTVPEKGTASSREKLSTLLTCGTEPGYVWNDMDETCKSKNIVPEKGEDVKFRDRCGGVGGTFKNEDGKMRCTVPNQGMYTSFDDLEKGIAEYTKCRAERKEWDEEIKVCKEPLQVQGSGQTPEIDDLKKQIEDLKQQLAGAQAQGSSQTQALAQQIANLTAELRRAQTVPPEPTPPPPAPPTPPPPPSPVPPPPTPPSTIVKKTTSILPEVEPASDLSAEQKIPEPSRETVFTPADRREVRQISGRDASALDASAQSAAQAAAEAARTASEIARAAQAAAAAATSAERSALAQTSNTFTRAQDLHGAYIQGKTGPEMLLYPLAIFGANGLYYYWRKRKKLK